MRDLVQGPAADKALRNFVDREQLVISKVIYVGAHHAEEHSFYEGLGVRDVLWIEASESNYRQLCTVIASKTHSEMRSTCLKALVSNTDGHTVELRHYNNDGASNTIFSANQQLEKTWPDLKETGKTEVLTTATLDRIANETGFLDADLLAVDVQGAELLVFKGADRVLRQVKVVVSEVSTKEFYAGGAPQNELKSLLEAYGFKIRSRTPTHGDQLFIRAR